MGTAKSPRDFVKEEIEKQLKNARAEKAASERNVVWWDNVIKKLEKASVCDHKFEDGGAFEICIDRCTKCGFQYVY